MEPDYRYKAVLVGDGGVGKTTLILRYTERKFRESYIPTIGVQFTVKEVQFKDTTVEFVLWDIAGQQQFRMMRSGFYAGSDAAVIVFDVTDVVSFGNVVNWYEELRHFRGNIPIVLLGNKVDLEADRVISYETAQELAQRLHIEFYETSAKTGVNVTTVFYNLIGNLIEGKPKPPAEISIERYVKETTGLFSILDELEKYIQQNGRIPLIIDKVNLLSKKIFQEDPYSPLLRDIAQFRIEYLNNYSSKIINSHDRTQLLLKIREWQKNPIVQQG